MNDGRVWRKRVPAPEQLRRECEALRTFEGPSVQLLDVRDDEVWLERIEPGTTAAEVSDAIATEQICRTLLSLWTAAPADCGLPSIEEECSPIFDRHATAPLPPDLVRSARDALASLLSDPPEPQVLHGDLHPQNLLWSDERGWVAIDPHGVVGDPGYDVGPLLINPWSRDSILRLPTRLPVLVGVLGIPVERVIAWGLVRAVLAESWTVQGNGRPHGACVELAKVLAAYHL